MSTSIIWTHWCWYFLWEVRLSLLTPWRLLDGTWRCQGWYRWWSVSWRGFLDRWRVFWVDNIHKRRSFSTRKQIFFGLIPGYSGSVVWKEKYVHTYIYVVNQETGEVFFSIPYLHVFCWQDRHSTLGYCQSCSCVLLVYPIICTHCTLVAISGSHIASSSSGPRDTYMYIFCTCMCR